MKKALKIFAVIVVITIGIIILDTIQALVFNNNPLIGIETKEMKKEGILVTNYHCGNGKGITRFKLTNYPFELVCPKEVKDDNNTQSKNSFKAKVLKNEGNHDLLVKVIENSNFFKKGDEVKVKIENYQYLSIYYAEDLTVEIDFNGNIEESYPPQIASSSISVLDYSTISIVANSKTISSKGATFSLKNYTDKEYIYGPDYYIETYENGNWKELSTLNGEPLTWNSIAYTLKANEEKEIKVDWTYAYGELKLGQYRLVKKVFKEEDRPITDDKILKLSSEFEIK